jgi:long-subunit fatty acid transport protein
MNKKSIILSLFLMLSVGISTLLEGQISTSSPYSRFGIGSEFNMNNVRNQSMGGISFGVRSNATINYRNPASYTSYDSTSFLFEAGIEGSSNTLTTFSATGKSNTASVSHLLMGFPVLKWWKTSFGFIPQSSIHYSITNLNTDARYGNTSQQFMGYGGLNKVYWGSGFKVGKYFSIGVNANYLFGTLNHLQRISFPDSVQILSAEIKNDLSVSDLSFDFGIQFHKKLSNNLALGIGATYADQTNLSSSREHLVRSYVGSDEIFSYMDTLVEEVNKSTLQLPRAYGFGVTLAKNKKWIFGFDYEWRNWSAVSNFFDDSKKVDSYSIGVGGEYTPNKYYALTYWQKMDYRLGLRYSKTPLLLHEKQIDEFGIDFGLGLPIKGLFLQGSKSKVNIGLEMGKRGTLANNLISETFVKFRLSVSIYEWWFIKRKFN